MDTLRRHGHSLGGWPFTDGAGVQISWDPLTNCQRDIVGSKGVHALAGAFGIYAYANSWVEITANSITDCTDEVSDIAILYPCDGMSTIPLIFSPIRCPMFTC